MPNIFKPFAKVLGPCDRRNLEREREKEFSQRIGQSCSFFDKTGVLEKVDSQHLWIRDAQGNLHIAKHTEAIFS